LQHTADFHEQVADTGLSEAAGIMDAATALDAAVDVLDAHTLARDAPIRRFLHARNPRPRGFRVGMITSTWSSVNARKPRSWSNWLPTDKR
jgi:hypothetical protein